MQQHKRKETNKEKRHTNEAEVREVQANRLQ